MTKKQKTKAQKARKYIVLVLIMSLIVWIGTDIAISFSVTSVPARPEGGMPNFAPTNQLLLYLENPALAEEDNIVIDNDYIIAAITPSAEYILGRYDCIDFRMQTLIRLQYLYGDVIADISPEGSEMIKNAFLGTKYWMTEPGEDSMCYWSENHQILFASAEYLAGQMWKDEIFTNDNSTGTERMERAKSRINHWMQLRFTYGFSEINSNNYYDMNFGAAANFIQFASEEDNDMKERMRMILDLLLYDVASNLYDYAFLAPSGRQVTVNKVGVSGDHMRKFIDYIWGLNDNHKTSISHMLINFVSMMEAEDSYGNKFYEVPEVILEIGRDKVRTVKSSSSLNTSELAERGLIGHSDKQIMMQLGMEAFTNPEVIHNTITYINKHNMQRNKTFNEFKYINLFVLRNLRLLKPISKILNPMPNGIALQRANIYSYQTEYYKLATKQAYHPGNYGGQSHTANAVLREDISIFTTHPAKYESKDSVTSSPGYWTGYGRAPHAAQHENILMSVYQLPKRANLTEFYDVPQFTHTYFPEALFDEVIIDGKYAFARVDGAFISLTGASDLEYLDYSSYSAEAFNNGLNAHPDKRFDLVQRGLNQFWIYELSDETNETFSEFIARIKANQVSFNGKDFLTYNSQEKIFSLKFKGDFTIDGVAQDFNYKRFESKYIVAERESVEFVFNFNDKTLIINYEEGKRIYS